MYGFDIAAIAAARGTAGLRIDARAMRREGMGKARSAPGRSPERGH